MMFDRFNNDTFYTEAPTFSKNNAYDALLLTAVQNALAKNFSITKQQLDQNYQEFKKNNTVPAALINGAKKSPPAQQAKQTDNNPTMPEVGATNVPQTPVEQKPSNQQQPAPEQKPAQSSLKEEWKEYVKSASGSGMYVSIIKNKNNTYTIEHSKTKTTIFMAPDGIGRNYLKLFISPDTKIQSLRNDLILTYFDITGAGPNGTSIVSITPALFDATNTKNVYTLNSKGIIETVQDQQPAQPQPQNQTQQAPAPAPAPQTQPAQTQQPAQNATTPTNQLSADFGKGQPMSETKIEMGLAQGLLKPYLEHRQYDGTYLFTPSDKNSRFIGFIDPNGQLMLFLNNAVLYRKDKPDPYWDNAGGIDELQASLGGDAKDTIFKDFSSAGGLILAQKPAVFEASDDNKYVKMISAGEIKQAPNQNAESK